MDAPAGAVGHGIGDGCLQVNTGAWYAPLVRDHLDPYSLVKLCRCSESEGTAGEKQDHWDHHANHSPMVCS